MDRPIPCQGQRSEGSQSRKGGNHGPRESSSTKLQAAAAAAAAKSLQSFPTLCDPLDGSPPGFSVPGILRERILQAGFVANQVFLGFWMVNILLRRCAGCTPRKLSSRDRRGKKWERPCSPNTWSPERLRSGKGSKCRPNRVFAFEEYPST